MGKGQRGTNRMSEIIQVSNNSQGKQSQTRYIQITSKSKGDESRYEARVICLIHRRISAGDCRLQAVSLPEEHFKAAIT